VCLAEHKGQVTTEKLSKQLRISRPFLAKILNKLSQERIVSTKKGKTGGVTLKAPATSLKTVVLMFDPKFAFNKCLTKNFGCFLGSKCPIHDFLCKAQNDLFRKLDSVSISQLSRLKI
jgi:Rrf2 family transcriptional regulator, iron-sulfur cluster assembly transcription factor